MNVKAVPGTICSALQIVPVHRTAKRIQRSLGKRER